MGSLGWTEVRAMLGNKNSGIAVMIAVNGAMHERGSEWMLLLHEGSSYAAAVMSCHHHAKQKNRTSAETRVGALPSPSHGRNESFANGNYPLALEGSIQKYCRLA